MKKLLSIAAMSLLLAGCSGLAPALDTITPPPIQRPATAALTQAADKLEKAERVYVEAAKLAVSGLETGWIAGENIQRVRVINQRATGAFAVAKAAVDAGDLALQGRQAETLMALAQQLLALAAP